MLVWPPGTCLENAQGLLVVTLTFQRFLEIHMPVAHPIERACQYEWIIHSARKRQRAVKVVSCLRVIESCPEVAKIEQALPFHLWIAGGSCRFQCPRVILTRCRGITEQLITLSARPV